MEINIREIVATDNKYVAEMIRAVFDEYNAKKEGTVYTDPTTDKLSELFKKKKSRLFIAEKNGIIHGCCGIYPTENLPNGCAELVKFYVSNAIRGKGIGRTLYLKSEQTAIELGYSQLYIESTDDFKDAVRIYKKIGFETLNAPLGTSGHFGCKIWMRKTL